MIAGEYPNILNNDPSVIKMKGGLPKKSGYRSIFVFTASKAVTAVVMPSHHGGRSI
jgi:hypothetical protein